MLKTVSKLKQPPSLKAKGVILEPLGKDDYKAVAPLLGVASPEEYQRYLKDAKREWRRYQKATLLVRKKSSGKVIAVLQARPAASKQMRMSSYVRPKYQDSPKLDRAMRALANWCLDHGAKRVFTISIY